MSAPASATVEPSFFHVLKPLPQESLLGFMWRLDAAHGWMSGSVATMLCTHRTGWKRASATMWSSGTIFDLRTLAALDLLPLESIEALTVLPDMRAATGERGISVHALGESGRLAYCPPCYAESGFVGRWCLLPFMTGCPRHLVRLEPVCRHAGEGPVAPVADPEAGVVRCPDCDTAVSASGEPLTAEEAAHLRDAWRAWRFLLGWRGDDIRGRGYRTIRSVTRNYPLRNLGDRVSFERLVSVFLALSIETDLVAALEDVPSRPCPNAACPWYAPPTEPDPLLSDRIAERHCPVCGCRFAGRRILLCFDAGHGSALPTARSVRKAQRRLRRWKRALVDQVADDLLEGRRILVADCFRRAGVPLNANLRASRLGLVDVVRDAARRQRLAHGVEPVAFSLVSMAEWRLLLSCAREGQWQTVIDIAQVIEAWPAHPVEALGFRYGDPRRDPLRGLLDPVLDPAADASAGGAADVRARLRALPGVVRPDELLSRHWDRRVAAAAAGDAPDTVVPLGAYAPDFRRVLGPEARAFAYGEWCPPYLLGLLVDGLAGARTAIGLAATTGPDAPASSSTL